MSGTRGPDSSGIRPVAFVGDSHLLAGEAIVDDFLGFLASAPGRFTRLVLVGDIFDLWLARPHLHEEHHRRVLAGLQRASSDGLAIDYAVGNRDFGIETLPDSPFSRVESVLLRAPGEKPAWIAEHGDLVNAADRQYRLWRSVARSRPVLGTFLRLPARVGIPASHRLERRMRTTNLAHKRRFPYEASRQRARALFRATGSRYLVLGHFHQELRFDAEPGEVLVLPDWKRRRRHAEWSPAADSPHGTMRFVESL